MTPKEKAIELFYKYLIVNDTVEDWIIDIGIDEEKTKQCALIEVDEVIKKLIEEISPNVQDLRYTYWKEVKQEIEKL